MRPKARLTALLGAALIIATVAMPVMAREGDVIRSGSCSGNSDWKLKAGHRDGRIEVEFEVDQNRVGRQWRVRLTDNGDVFFRGIRTTQAPSGSFSVDRTTRNRTGDDRLVGRAVNLNSGEVCRGVLVTR
jgi:hypothetical protein